MKSENAFKINLLLHSKTSILFLLFLSFSHIQGQTTYQISGRAVDESDKKIGPVRVVLYNLDKKLITDITTKGNGKFKIKDLAPGNYTMNLYMQGGYHGTENITITDADISDFEPNLSFQKDQPQVATKSMESRIELTWEHIVDTDEYIVFRDNNEIGKVKTVYYVDELEGGKTFAYNIVAVNTDGEKSPRSITEYGKALLGPPQNLKADVKSNKVKLSWDKVESAVKYSVFIDGNKVSEASNPTIQYFKLKYGTEYSYTISSVDFQGDEGPASKAIIVNTHPEVKKPTDVEAERGEEKVILTWNSVDVAVSYKVYQNGGFIDTTDFLTLTVPTVPGSENCFTISAIDKYGTEGEKSSPACDVSVYPPPDTLTLTGDKLNKISIEWSKVEGAMSYNVYRDGDLITNTDAKQVLDRGLKWDKEYQYYITSLTSNGLEGPESEIKSLKTPPIFTISGILIDENGKSSDVDEAKVFLYDEEDNLLETFLISAFIKKFRFEKEIISGKYTIKVYGDGSGNGGKRVEVTDSDITGLEIQVFTEGLVPDLRVERGINQLTVIWNDFPQMKSYNIYKNDRFIKNIIKDTSYVDEVAPGRSVCYTVATIDIYDLEGPKSETICEKSSHVYPELIPSVLAGGYTVDGSGRQIKLDWQAVAGVNQYALYKNGKLLSKQSETTFLDTNLVYGTEYTYEINSIDKNDLEGVNCPEIVVKTHTELTIPDLTLNSMINAINLKWTAIESAVNYKIYRNTNYLTDSPEPSFIDNVKPEIQYKYSVAAEDMYQTIGPPAIVQSNKAWFAPPSNFTGDIIKNKITLNWPPVTGVSGYRLYRDGDLILDTKDGNIYIDSLLAFDTEYMYQISSYDKDGDDGPKVDLTLRTHEEVLATSMDGNADLEKISLGWKKSNLQVDHSYRIYRDGTLLDETRDTTYQDPVPPGKYYCYSIAIIDTYGTESPKSNEECLKVLVNFPKDLIINGDVKRVLFRWRKMLGADHYNIYLVDKKTKAITFLSKTKGSYFEDKGLEFDTEYCYKVSSVDGDGDEGPLSPTMCGWVLPPPHLTLVEKKFVEESGNGLLDSREHGWIIVKIVNDGRSPARELKPWLQSLDDTMTPSIKIDSVAMIPKLNVGDTLTINFRIYAKLKVESDERKFNIRVNEFTGMDIDPEPIAFTTLSEIPPNFVITDFAIENEWGQHYIPKNEIVTLTVRLQNMSEGKSDTSSLGFRRDSSFTIIDKDELQEFGFVNAGEYMDFSYDIMSRENRFTVYLDVFDYFGTKKTFPIHLQTMKQYKGKEDIIHYETPYPKFISVGEEPIFHELSIDIPKATVNRETIGIIIGNDHFVDSTITGKSSTIEDVKIVREYFHDLFGLGDQSIVPSQYWFFHDGISSRDFQEIFDPVMGYIRKKIETSIDYQGNKTLDLLVYFSGEGTTFGGQKCLIPYDANPRKPYSFFPVKELYKNLEKIQIMEEIGEITLFMDVDFNNPAFEQNVVKLEEKDPKKKKRKGKSKKSDVLLSDEIKPPETITAFYASDVTQITYDHPDIANGIFTYYLLKGLRGDADNGDKKVTVAELHAYISKNVKDTTSKLYQDLPQVPILFSSNSDRILYRLP